jgi:SAM-dependent methyltransferase
MTEQEILKQIGKVPAWWHNIDIEGVVTPGITPPNSQKWIESHLPESFKGLDVLDIGAWDGYYSFLAERRGAKRVVACDAYQGPCRPDGFLMAKKLLKSKVEHHVTDVYQIDRIEGAFDYIFFFGVYYHLEDPILALHRIFKKLKPGGVALIEGIVRSGNRPYLYAYRPGVDLSPGDFCAATIPWFQLVCGRRIGFESCTLLSRYAGDHLLERPIRTFAWLSGIHWGKFKKANRAMLRVVKPLHSKFSDQDSESRDLFLAKFNSTH